MNQPSPLFAEPVIPEPNDWMVDPNEPRYCLCNQVSGMALLYCSTFEMKYLREAGRENSLMLVGVLKLPVPILILLNICLELLFVCFGWF